jgi:hypothetical protein
MLRIQASASSTVKNVKLNASNGDGVYKQIRLNETESLAINDISNSCLTQQSGCGALEPAL